MNIDWLKGLSVYGQGCWKMVHNSTKTESRSLHFLGLRTILFVAAQVPILPNSDCKIDMYTSFAGADSDMAMSSTYFQYVQQGKANFKSFIIITKRIGSTLDLWGTPARTGSQLETVYPSLTHCQRSVGKLQIRGIMERRTPNSVSFLLRMVWSILSNALLKSRKQALKKQPGFSSSESQLWMRSSRLLVEGPLRLPNWRVSTYSQHPRSSKRPHNLSRP